LRGEKQLNVIASENEISPNQIRNWKAELLANAPVVFDDKKVENLKAELKQNDSETDTLYKKVGQLTEPHRSTDLKYCFPLTSYVLT